MRAALADAAARLGAPVAASSVELERPRDPAHGDVATNLALVLAKPLKAKPRAVAERLVAVLELSQGLVRKIDIAGPGFINFFLAEAQLASVLEAVLAAGDRYGKSDVGQGRSVNVRSEEHTSELQSPCNLVCRLLLEKKKKKTTHVDSLRSDQWSA